MTFRGVVKNGVVVMDVAAGLREGDVVEVARMKRTGTGSKRKVVKASSKRGGKKLKDPLPGFGMWKDRPEWKGMTGPEIAAELRRGTFRRKARS